MSGNEPGSRPPATRPEALPAGRRPPRVAEPPDSTRLGTLGERGMTVGCLGQFGALLALSSWTGYHTPPGGLDFPGLLVWLAAHLAGLVLWFGVAPLALLVAGSLLGALVDTVLQGLGVFPEQPALPPARTGLMAEGSVLPGLPAGWRERGSGEQVFGFMGFTLGNLLLFRGVIGLWSYGLWSAFHLALAGVGFLARAASSALGRAEIRVPVGAAAPGDRVPIEVCLAAARDLTIDALGVALVRYEWRPGAAADSYWETVSEQTFPVGGRLGRGEELRTVVHLELPSRVEPAVLGSELRRRWFLVVKPSFRGWPTPFLSWRFKPLDGLPEDPDEEAGSRREPLVVAPEVLARSTTCPFCGDALAGLAVVACARCDTLHHQDCWASAGLCTTYACGGRETRTVVLAAAVRNRPRPADGVPDGST